MTRRELVERVREGLSTELTERQVAEVIERALAGEAIDIPASATVGFKPAAELRAGLPDPG
jgi:nucleoid DNA-binding protein